jgi:hypothetical protein
MAVPQVRPSVSYLAPSKLTIIFPAREHRHLAAFLPIEPCNFIISSFMQTATALLQWFVIIHAHFHTCGTHDHSCMGPLSSSSTLSSCTPMEHIIIFIHMEHIIIHAWDRRPPVVCSSCSECVQAPAEMTTQAYHALRESLPLPRVAAFSDILHNRSQRRFTGTSTFTNDRSQRRCTRVPTKMLGGSI